jgi:glutathione peroxidase-family protein
VEFEDVVVNAITGEPVRFADYAGRVGLVVNVASK